MAPCSFATSKTFSRGTNRNSAFGSTNFLTSHGHAIRSTFAFSRVTISLKSSLSRVSTQVVHLCILSIPTIGRYRPLSRISTHLNQDAIGPTRGELTAATAPRGMKIGAVSLWLLLLLSEKPMYGYEVIL